jgi:GGDEF domain-containing protein
MIMLKTFRRRQFSESRIEQVTYPSLAQLSDSIVQLGERTDRGIRICWPHQSGQGEYQLLIHNSGAIGAPFWELQMVTGQIHDSLWNQVSSDAALLHHLLATSCGAPTATIQSKGVISTAEASRSSPTKHQDDYIPSNTQDSQREGTSFLRELIKSVESAAAAPPVKTLKPKIVDAASINAIRAILRNPHSNLLFYAAFLYELEQEYVRNYRNKANFSVLILQFMSAEVDEDGSTSRGTADIVWIAETLTALKRASDLVGHYEGGMLCMLLPNTDATGAQKYAKRLTKRFQQASVRESRHLSLSIGYGTFPEQCSDLGMLLAIAEASLTNLNLA